MEETYVTQAIILKREPFRERDSRIVVLSPEQGKLELIVRGTGNFKSKMAGHIEPISLADIMVVRGRACDYAGSILSQRIYPGIKDNFLKIAAAGQALRSADKAVNLNETGDAPGLFALLRDYLDTLEAAEKTEMDYGVFFHFFLLKLLAILGYAPELHNCQVCGQKIIPGKNFFSPSRGGLKCGNCRPEFDNRDLMISDNCVKVLILAINSEQAQLIRLKIDSKLSEELANIISSLKNYHTDF